MLEPCSAESRKVAHRFLSSPLYLPPRTRRGSHGRRTALALQGPDARRVRARGVRSLQSEPTFTLNCSLGRESSGDDSRLLTGRIHHHSIFPMATPLVSRPTVSLSRVNCTDPGRGSWRLTALPGRRCFLVQNQRTKSRHAIFYGTRTRRTIDDAERHATALCAVLNALKAKRV